MYSGQAANSFMQGMKGGYETVDNAKTNSQNREIKSQQASQKAEAHRKMMDFEDAKVSQAQSKAAGYEVIEQQMNEYGDKIARMEGGKFTTSMGTVLGSENPEEALASAMSQNKDNPALQAMGIENPKSVRIPNGKNKTDRNKIIKAMGDEGYDFVGYNQKELDEIADSVGDSGYYVEADGMMVNMDSLSIVTGATDSMSISDKKAYDKKKDGIQSLLDTTQKNVDTRSALEIDADDKELKALKEKHTNKAEQLAGVANKDKTKTINHSSLLNDWMKKNPDLANDTNAILAASTAFKGGATGNMAVYDKQKSDLMQTINPATGKYYTEPEAGVAVMSKGPSIGNSVKAEIEVNSKELGSLITTTGGYKTLGISTESNMSEARLVAQNSKLEKARSEYRDKTVNTDSVITATNRVIDGIDSGLLNFSITTSFQNTLMGKTPDEIYKVVHKMSDDLLGETLSEEAFAERLGIDGELGIVIAQMTKEYFGRNASNQDRKTFVDSFGIGKWTNTKAVRAKMANMQTSMHRKFIKESDELIDSGLTYTPSKAIIGLPELTTLSDKKGEASEKASKPDWDPSSGTSKPKGYKPPPGMNLLSKTKPDGTIMYKLAPKKDK